MPEDAPTQAPSASTTSTRPKLPGQVVLVLQGGGALGAYQVGVYQALHEAGVEPVWVIGTSIGAINGAIIAGNPPEHRLARLTQFWNGVHNNSQPGLAALLPALAPMFATLGAFTHGIESFFKPNPYAAWGVNAPVGLEHAAFYTTAPLQQTLEKLIDFDYLNAKHTRLTLGAVNVCNGEMSYFDSRDRPLDVKHVMASGALPPAFPAVRIDDTAYWDGGIYSNTPIEVVLDDKPRRDSLIFAANVWQSQGAEPQTILEVLARQKDIQFASRAQSHVARQQQIHRLRHIIRDLEQHIPAKERTKPAVRKLLAYGCATVMHIIPLWAPRLEREDLSKDIDFTPGGIEARWQAGYAHTQRALAAAPWQAHVDAMDGVIVHDEIL